MILGITGGTGSGKSEVCRVFEAEGAGVIDADVVGHETLADPDVARRLAAAFGQGILDAEGCVVRRALGLKSFESEVSRKQLTDVVWPEIAGRIRELTARWQAERPGRTVVIDAPLLIEWDTPKAFCDQLVVVTAPSALRVGRTMSRLGLSETEVEARMAFQLPDEEKARFADHVIDNSGSLSALQCEARRLWKLIHAETRRESRA